MKKKKALKPRLPKEALSILRKGGLHMPKKGGRYKRSEEKIKVEKEND